MFFSDLRFRQIVFDRVDGSGKRQIQRPHLLAVCEKHRFFLCDLAGKQLSHAFFFLFDLGIELLCRLHEFVDLLRRLELQRHAHIVLIRHFEFFKRLNHLEVRVGFGDHDIEFRRQLYAVFFSQLLTSLFLLSADLLFVFFFLCPIRVQLRTEFVVDIEGVHAVPARVQFIEQILGIRKEIFLRHRIDRRFSFRARRGHILRARFARGAVRRWLGRAAAVRALIISDFVLHRQLAQLPHLQKQRFDFKQFHR